MSSITNASTFIRDPDLIDAAEKILLYATDLAYKTNQITNELLLAAIWCYLNSSATPNNSENSVKNDAYLLNDAYKVSSSSNRKRSSDEVESSPMAWVTTKTSCDLVYMRTENKNKKRTRWVPTDKKVFPDRVKDSKDTENSNKTEHIKSKVIDISKSATPIQSESSNPKGKEDKNDIIILDEVENVENVENVEKTGLDDKKESGDEIEAEVSVEVNTNEVDVELKEIPANKDTQADVDDDKDKAEYLEMHCGDENKTEDKDKNEKVDEAIDQNKTVDAADNENKKVAVEEDNTDYFDMDCDEIEDEVEEDIHEIDDDKIESTKGEKDKSKSLTGNPISSNVDNPITIISDDEEEPVSKTVEVKQKIKKENKPKQPTSVSSSPKFKVLMATQSSKKNTPKKTPVKSVVAEVIELDSDDDTEKPAKVPTTTPVKSIKNKNSPKPPTPTPNPQKKQTSESSNKNNDKSNQDKKDDPATSQIEFTCPIFDELDAMSVPRKDTPQKSEKQENPKETEDSVIPVSLFGLVRKSTGQSTSQGSTQSVSEHSSIQVESVYSMSTNQDDLYASSSMPYALSTHCASDQNPDLVSQSNAVMTSYTTQSEVQEGSSANGNQCYVTSTITGDQQGQMLLDPTGHMVGSPDTGYAQSLDNSSSSPPVKKRLLDFDKKWHMEPKFNKHTDRYIALPGGIDANIVNNGDDLHHKISVARRNISETGFHGDQGYTNINFYPGPSVAMETVDDFHSNVNSQYNQYQPYDQRMSFEVPGSRSQQSVEIEREYSDYSDEIDSDSEDNTVKRGRGRGRRSRGRLIRGRGGLRGRPRGIRGSRGNGRGSAGSLRPRGRGRGRGRVSLRTRMNSGRILAGSNYRGRGGQSSSPVRGGRRIGFFSVKTAVGRGRGRGRPVSVRGLGRGVVRSPRGRAVATVSVTRRGRGRPPGSTNTVTVNSVGRPPLSANTVNRVGRPARGQGLRGRGLKPPGKKRGRKPIIVID